MVKDINSHWLQNDFRYESLNQIISGLNNSICSLKDRMKEVNWYDGLWFLEETETIYGLAFIAFQNYINGSVKDFSEDTKQKEKYYKLESKFKDFEKSSIELIIGLANYSKHKDDELLHKGTIEILTSFKLNFGIDVEIEQSPIFRGLTILDEQWDLFKIVKIVKDWRENLWLTLR